MRGFPLQGGIKLFFAEGLEDSPKGTGQAVVPLPPKQRTRSVVSAEARNGLARFLKGNALNPAAGPFG